MSDYNEKNWMAVAQNLERANAERATVFVELDRVRAQLADANSRIDMMGQQVQNLQVKMLILNGGYRG